MRRHGNARWCRMGLSLGLALLLAPVVLHAQQQDSQERQQNQKREQNQQQQEQNQQEQSQVQIELPPALEKLDLTEDQKKQIVQKVLESNRQIAQTWRQFHELHMQAVNLEAAMLATIEQNLSESQREQFRKSRTQRGEAQPFAQQQKSDPSQQSTQEQQTREQVAQREQQRDQQQPQRRESAYRPGSLQAQEDAPEHGILILGISVQSPREQFQKMGLSEEEQKKCGEACQPYTNTLRTTWKKLHALHLRMVDLEADKVAGIQEVLTEEQLQKLRQSDSDSEKGSQRGEQDRQQQKQQNQPQKEQKEQPDQQDNPLQNP